MTLLKVKRSLPRSEGAELINDINRVKKERIQTALTHSAPMVFLRSLIYMVFGACSLITSALAAFYIHTGVFMRHDYKLALYSAVFVTVAPAAFMLGRFILAGTVNIAKK